MSRASLGRPEWALVAGLLATFVATASGGEGGLEAKLLPLIEAHKGKVTVALKHLDTGETYAYHADEPMPTASLIKFPVMIEAYRQAEEGKLDLDGMVTLKSEDKVPGSGILTENFSGGATFSVRDAIRLMIVFSDNTATNLVLDQIGLGATAETMEKMGYPNTKIHSKVYRRDTSIFPERSEKFGLGSTTATEMIRLFEALHKRELVSADASESMTDALLHCDDKEKFPRFLPPGTKVAFKTGSVNASRTCAGIIQTPGGPVALCVMTTDNEDQSWGPQNAGNVLCAEVAKAVYDYFTPPAQPEEGKPEGSAPAKP